MDLSSIMYRASHLIVPAADTWRSRLARQALRPTEQARFSRKARVRGNRAVRPGATVINEDVPSALFFFFFSRPLSNYEWNRVRP